MRPILNISPRHVYRQGVEPEPVSNHHRPYFMVLPEGDVKACRENISGHVERAMESGDGNDPFSLVDEVGRIEEEPYTSFWDSSRKFPVFKVYTKRSFHVPQVSDAVFLKLGINTGEHDIPYQQRAVVDLAAEKDWWVWDTGGEEASISVLTYDIETTQYQEGRTDVPIDVIGYSSFNLSYSASKDIDNEDFQFQFHGIDGSWESCEIEQLTVPEHDDRAGEVENLLAFIRLSRDFDIIAGHNVLTFDNTQVVSRVEGILSENDKSSIISGDERTEFKKFLNLYTGKDRIFHFGQMNSTTNIYPTTLDTYLAARRFFFFLSEFSLKELAPFMGIHIPDRKLLSWDKLDLKKAFTETLLYNKHDVQEQLGITMLLVQQALPLSFTTGMPLEMLLSSMNTKTWDHMALVRAARRRKLMPPTSKAEAVSKHLMRNFPNARTKTDIQEALRSQRWELEGVAEENRELLRIAKYGREMPDWVEYPFLVRNRGYRGERRYEEVLGYHLPGGLTIKPDEDVDSNMLQWWHVVVADVGAMYPTILKGLNVGADSVRLAGKGDKPDEWVWLRSVPQEFLDWCDSTGNGQWRQPPSDYISTKGYLFGIMRDPESSMVNLAMTAIMKLIAQVKSDLKKAKESGAPTDEVQRQQMTYDSLKAARNAGTHGILAAAHASCRQFNIWGASYITTIGQMILNDTLQYLDSRGMRVVYGDTDGIYIACSKNAASNPQTAAALGLQPGDDWLSQPEDVYRAIEHCNLNWRKRLSYEDFELEPEEHAAMLFVKHKNYLIWDVKNGELVLTTKGNNFKGSDKANIAQNFLQLVMNRVAAENVEWDDPDDAREKIELTIKRNAIRELENLNLDTVDIGDLTLVQVVRPPGYYKPIETRTPQKRTEPQDMSSLGDFSEDLPPVATADNAAAPVSTGQTTGSNTTPSVHAQRAMALERLLGHPIRASLKMKFVVTKDPLPGITKLSKTSTREKYAKSGVKPIDFMYPLEYLQERGELEDKLDIEWYRGMVENYITGAFGFRDLSTTLQKGLETWGEKKASTREAPRARERDGQVSLSDF